MNDHGLRLLLRIKNVHQFRVGLMLRTHDSLFSWFANTMRRDNYVRNPYSSVLIQLFMFDALKDKRKRAPGHAGAHLHRDAGGIVGIPDQILPLSLSRPEAVSGCTRTVL